MGQVYWGTQDHNPQTLFPKEVRESSSSSRESGKLLFVCSWLNCVISNLNLWLLCMDVNYCITEVLQALTIVGGGNFKSLINTEVWVDDDPDDTQAHNTH